jgi:exodeoxyribonuclease V gamma subunit
MALPYKTSENMQACVNALADDIKKNTNVFSPYFIVTTHNSTNDWITNQVAQRNSIVANVVYKKPDQFLDTLYNNVAGEVTRKELLNETQLTWLIYEVIKNSEFTTVPEHKKVVDYAKDDELKQYTFSEKIASLFMQYQKTKTDLINAWNNDTLITENQDEIWQKFIWRAIEVNTQGRLPDQTKAYAEIKSGLKDTEKANQLKSKVPYVAFFGSNFYTKEYLDFIKDLSEIINVSIYRLEFNPDATAGRLGKCLGSFAQKQNVFFEDFKREVLIGNSEKRPSLLNALQGNIRGQILDYKYKTEDDSIVINNCFSKNREVEVLYHYLVRQFELNKELMMQDVCVIVPELDAYVPAIQSVFSQKPFDIDVTFYDTSHKVTASPYKALQALLDLDMENFTSKRVLALLDFDFIRNKFGFTDLELLSRAVIAANIRHGLDGNTEWETDTVSWKHGLKKLIYGFCLAPQTDAYSIDEDSYFNPVDCFEDSDTIEIIKLLHFIQTLEKWLNTRDQSRSLSGWVRFIEEDTMTTFLDGKDYDLKKFTHILSDTEKAAKYASLDNITYRTFRHFINAKLENLESGKKAGYSGVRFISANAYLSAPAKIYAFLGVNSSSFPRTPGRLSFDLSDPDGVTINDLDKNLFLNVILLAREKCYFSYVGQSIKDNSEILASTVVEELLSSIGKYLPPMTPDELKNFITEHPLHSFSTKYNTEEKLYRYGSKREADNSWLKKENAADKEPFLRTGDDGKFAINLHDLINFLKDPIKHYYNKVLGLYIDGDSDDLQEVEPFTLTGLEAWKVKKLILDEHLKTKDTLDDDALLAQLRQNGILPLKNFGALCFDKNKEAVTVMLGRIVEFRGIEAAQCAIEISLDEYYITGTVIGIYNEIFAFITTSKDKLKYRLEAAVNFLALRAAGKNYSLKYITCDDNTQGQEINAEVSKVILTDLCNWYRQGMEEILLFTTEFDVNERTNILNSNPASAVQVQFQAILDGYDAKYYSPSQYFLKELEQKSFAKEDKAKQFIEFYNYLDTTMRPITG